MAAIRVMGLVVVAAALWGCAPAQPPAPPPAAPPSADQVQRVREIYAHNDPSARVGTVTTVRADQGLLAVTQLPANEMRDGAAITIIDSNEDVLANGTVINRDPANGLLAVKYQKDAAAKRDPVEGDIAVTFLRKP